MKKIKLLSIIPFFALSLVICESCGPESLAPSIQGIAIKVTENTNAKKLLEGINVSITSANKNDAKTTGTDGTCRWEGLDLGNYIITVTSSDYRTQSKVVVVADGKLSEQLFQLDALPMLEVSPLAVNFNNTKKTETVYFKNRSTQGDINLSIEGFEKWLSVSETNLTIPAKQQKAVTFTADTKGIGFGATNTKVILNYRLNGNGDNTDMTVYLNLTNPQAPSIETNNATGISQTSADITGVITNTGGSPVVQKGITWSEGSDPKPESDSKDVLSGGGIGSFTLTAKSLKEGKIYYARAFATNSSGTSLGNVVQFTTATTPTPPSVTIEPVKNITINSAALTGKLSNTGGSNVTEQGFCWNTTGNPKITDNKIQASQDASGNFSVNMTGLTQGLVYYVRAYAINDLGANNAGYSNVATFKTQVPTTPAKLSTAAPTNITETTARLQGSVTELGSSPIKEHGFVWSRKNATPEIENSEKNQMGSKPETGSFTANLSSLKKGTLYYVRTYAINNEGKTSYGNVQTLVTKEQGLVLYYPFNSDASDISGNGNNAIATAKLTEDQFSNEKSAYDLSTGTVQIQNETIGRFSGDFTYCFWVKINGSAFKGSQKVLFSKGPTWAACFGDSYWSGFMIYTNTTNSSLNLFVQDTKNNQAESKLFSSDVLSDGWHHIVLSKTGNSIKTYLDGDYHSLFNVNISAFGYYSDPNRGQYDEGRLTFSSLPNPKCTNLEKIIATIDDFRLYSYGLSGTEVEELYKR